MFFKRNLNLKELLKKKSFFLFGPRGTGKTQLIRHQLFDHAIIIDLLKTEFQMRLLREPFAIREIIKSLDHEKKKWIVIDEIQKVPMLLDEVHRMIEEEKRTFLLTGSSARRLKKGFVNLLAGRAWRTDLFSLSYSEIPKFNLDRYLRYGGLPAVWLSEQPEEELDAYVSLYLNEEIKAEGAIRKITPFVEFLRFAALSNGQILNYSKIANDAGVSPPTIASYFEILEDTLLGTKVEPWQMSKKRKAITSGRFYFFDPGVLNTLAGTKAIDRNSNLFGNLFEQWIFMELRAYLNYQRIKEKITFWRTEEKDEVDLIIGNEIAIECKTTKKLSSSDFKGLLTIQEEKILKRFIIVSFDPIERIHQKIECLRWENFVEKLWKGKIIS